ncbi:MAG: CvpA family protein [Gammaproteobacteria bacterium]|nr:CvpA family protein [Gammaproteobacteria bacterium]NND53627.1 CvpA family protein [Gammaproteobacteria bacterium]
MVEEAAQLVLFDYLLIAILGFSTLISLFRGFFKEAMSLGTWVVAIWAAWKFGPQVAGLLESLITPTAMRLWAARALTVIAVLIAGGLLGAFFHFVLETTGLTGTDRAIGMVFGFGRGVVLAGLLLAIMQSADFDETEWWPQSVLIPYFEPVTDMIRHAAEDGLDFLDDLEDEAAPEEVAG